MIPHGVIAVGCPQGCVTTERLAVVVVTAVVVVVIVVEDAVVIAVGAEQTVVCVALLPLSVAQAGPAETRNAIIAD